MPETRLLNNLTDPQVLLPAYAASSAYVMHRAFQDMEEMEVFRSRAEMAPALVERLQALQDETTDAVILGAHLHALSLTGDPDNIRRGVRGVLKQDSLRGEPLVRQLAAFEGAEALHLRTPSSRELSFPPEEIDSILEKLEQEEVH